jgi:Ca2+/Na+ antiporter
VPKTKKRPGGRFYFAVLVVAGVLACIQARRIQRSTLNIQFRKFMLLLLLVILIDLT